jgi:hypothetical protein
MTIAIIAIANISPIRLRGIDFVILRWHSCGCMIKRIKFLGIPVRDQDRALQFYTEKLGMRILTDQEFSEKQRWIELSIPGAETGIVLFTPEGHEDRIGTFVNTSWEVDNIEKTYDDLRPRCRIRRPSRKAAVGDLRYPKGL